MTIVSFATHIVANWDRAAMWAITEDRRDEGAGVGPDKRHDRFDDQ